MIDDPLHRLDAGVTEDGEIIIQTHFDGRRLENELLEIKPAESRLYVLPKPGSGPTCPSTPDLRHLK
jgi:hypothetical protein